MGRGFIVREDETTKTCPHILVQRFYAKWLRSLGDAAQPMIDIPRDERLRETPLYVPGEVDLTRQNVVIQGACWLRFLNHLRWVLLIKGLDYQVRVTTDSQIKNVFVGNERVNAVKSQEDLDEKKAVSRRREATAINNSLYDLAGGPDLLIIRLGMLGHTNKAAAGALVETLRIRQHAHRPTWLWEMPGKPFEECHSYNEEAAVLIEPFRRLSLGDDESDPYEVDMTEGEELLDEMDEAPSDEPEPDDDEPEPDDDDGDEEEYDEDEMPDLTLPGEGPSNPWSRGRNNNRNRRGGGGGGGPL